MVKDLAAQVKELQGSLSEMKGTAGPSKQTTEPKQEMSTQGESTTTPPVERALQEAAPAKPAKAEPFAYADWTWLNGNPRTKTPAFDSKFFTPEIRADVDYHL